MSELDALGCKYGTTKASNTPGTKNNYLPFYEVFLAPIRYKPITLLEIGVEHGNSLRMWREYFPNARIIGIDCNDLRGRVVFDGIEIDMADQNQAADLDRIAENYGPFDVIVDDAGHHPPSQVFCYGHMLQYVKDGGFYILEDLVDHDGPFLLSDCTDFLRDIGNQVMQHISPDRISSIAFSYGTSVTRIGKY
jgi:hypothetical protein